MAPFGGKGTYSLATMQYNKFVRNCLCLVCIARTSAPTEYATNLHCHRAYYQVMVWAGKEEGMDLRTSAMWIQQDYRLLPLMSTMNAAPDNLLKIIHCNCFTACKTPRCSCRRYGLPCSTVCGPCQIDECDKPYNRFLPEELEDDDE